MITGIAQSVGINGVNQRKDVRIIQAYLNSFTAWEKPIETLKIDGYAGKKTDYAIKQFQRQAIGIKKPDGRVDPNGKTFRYLTMYHDQKQQVALETAALANGKISKDVLVANKSTTIPAGLVGFTVSYKNNIKKKKKNCI